MKKYFTFLLAMVMVFSLVTTAVAGPPQRVMEKKQLHRMWKAKFKDMGDHWAAEEVAEMSVKGFIKGYEDFTFRPKASVTNEQALAMIVRAVYPDAEVDIEDEMVDMKHWKQISSTWALEALAVALDKGLTTDEEMFKFIPRKAAKRIDVARYIARALDSEDIKTADVGLDFIDMDKVDDDDMSIMAQVVAVGIFNGNPDGTFKPHKAVTRAEMALLLGRLDENIENPADEDEVKGILEDLDEDVMELTLEGKSGVYDINEDVAVFRNNRGVDLDDLEMGDEVLLLFNEDGEITFIGAREVQEEETVEGVVTDVYDGDEPWIKIEDDDDDITKYMVDEDADIEIDGEDRDLHDVDEDDFVTLKLVDHMVVSIEVEAVEREYEGEIDEIDDDEIVLLIDDEKVSFDIDEDTEIELDGEEVDWHDLAEGDWAEVEVVRDTAVTISVEYEEEDMEGYFLSYDDDDDEIVVLIGGEQRTLPLADDVEIEIIDDLELDELIAGTKVELEVKNGEVTRLEADVN
ncbi:S-layer homology domain-containing protein [Metallumcola ferriviriculae]|uniref:S-layer homology domain-containing protein n=1 Tax=Metallumcola ferriviriculae TaxID=3039180 RepID=A0AAU0ULY4_9FIRM|nr:S-layer homology domain-containing protein [Desulfitibacteraceae bacterium MK1]